MKTRANSGCYGWTFGLTILLHVSSWALLLNTGSDRAISLTGGLVALFIAFVIAATVCWQWKIFGDPKELHNAIGHVLILLTIFFLVIRLQTRVVEHLTLLSFLGKAVEWSNRLLGILPDSILQILKSPGNAALFVGVCVALSLRRDRAVGAFLLVTVFGIAVRFFNDDFGSRLPFLGGIAFFGAALWLQYNDEESRSYWRAVQKRLGIDQHVRGDLELKYRLLLRLRQEGRPLSEQECVATVERALDVSPTTPGFESTVARVIRQAVCADGLAEVHHNASGRQLALNPALLAVEEDWFTTVAAFPKACIIFLIAFVWVLSPIDVLPDSMPFGALDDVVVSLAGGSAIARMFQWARIRRQGQGTLSGPLASL